jgi:hypothetical protein
MGIEKRGNERKKVRKQKQKQKQKAKGREEPTWETGLILR